jgi:hypothetical protein
MKEHADNRYADIIHLPHPVSTRHPQMSMADRAAQFSPFAALTGHDAAIAEAARHTTERPLLDEMQKWEISDRLQEATTPPLVPHHITWFVPDARKSGGCCTEACGIIQKLLPHEKLVMMQDGTRIRVEDIIDIKRL